MLKRIYFLLLMLVSAWSLVTWAKVPRPLPTTAIPTTSGKTIRLQQYKGKVMTVLLFSTRCAECIDSLEILNKAQKQYGPRGFQAVAAAVNADAPEEIKGFVDRYRPTFPTGHLGQQELISFADLAPGQRPFVPIFIFIDHTGAVRYQYFGNEPIMKQQEKATLAIISSLLNFRDNPTKQGK